MLHGHVETEEDMTVLDMLNELDAHDAHWDWHLVDDLDKFLEDHIHIAKYRNIQGYPKYQGWVQQSRYFLVSSYDVDQSLVQLPIALNEPKWEEGDKLRMTE